MPPPLKSLVLFTLVKGAGAAYLIWIGVRALGARTGHAPPPVTGAAAQPGPAPLARGLGGGWAVRGE